MDPRRNPVCLIVKDPQREYKDMLEEKKIKFISRVVGMEKLQGKVSVCWGDRLFASERGQGVTSLCGKRVYKDSQPLALSNVQHLRG